MSFLLKGVHDRLNLLGSFEGGDQVPFFIVQGQVREVLYLIKRSQEEFFVPSYFDIGVFGQFVVCIKVLHFREGLVSGHDDLDVLEMVPIPQDRFRLVFAMVAVGAEEHDDGAAVLLEAGFVFLQRGD